jgi:hypothetical protein
MGQLPLFSMFAPQNIHAKRPDFPSYLVGRHRGAIFTTVMLWLGLSLGGIAYAEQHEDVESRLPVTVIDGSGTGISEFLAFGPWEIPSRGSILWGQLGEPPFNAKPHLISNDDNVEVHVNGKYLGVAGNWVLPQGGQFHAFPVMLEKGENTLAFKHVTSNWAPRFKVNVVCDGSREFDAAWGPKEGLLTRLVYTPDRPQEKPSVQWPSLLEHMAAQAEVMDVFSDKTLQMQLVVVRKLGKSNH